MTKARGCDRLGTGFIEVQNRKTGIVGLRQIFPATFRALGSAYHAG